MPSHRTTCVNSLFSIAWWNVDDVIRIAFIDAYVHYFAKRWIKMSPVVVGKKLMRWLFVGRIKPRDHIEIPCKGFDVIPALWAYCFLCESLRDKPPSGDSRTLLPWVLPRKALPRRAAERFVGGKKFRYTFCPSPGQGNTFCLDTKSIQKSPCFI